MNPLYNVLEKIELYAFSNNVVDNEIVTVRSRCKYLIALKPLDVLPRYVILKGNDLTKLHYRVYIFRPSISIKDLIDIEGFGVDRVEYQIINRDQATLKVINKVFGIRCICQKID